MKRPILLALIAAISGIAIIGLFGIAKTENDIINRDKSIDKNTIAVNDSFLENVQIPEDRYLRANVSINGKDVIADLAIKDDQQIMGLSIKDSINENEGMLFVFQKGIHNSFWMKGMKFPIDIIWLDENKRVVHIEENLDPCTSTISCPTYGPEVETRYVLEVMAGFSKKYNISIGDTATFDLLD